MVVTEPALWAWCPGQMGREVAEFHRRKLFLVGHVPAGGVFSDPSRPYGRARRHLEIGAASRA